MYKLLLDLRCTCIVLVVFLYWILIVCQAIQFENFNLIGINGWREFNGASFHDMVETWSTKCQYLYNFYLKKIEMSNEIVSAIFVYHFNLTELDCKQFTCIPASQ